MQLSKFTFLLCLSLVSMYSHADYRTEIIKIKDQSFNVTHWFSKSNEMATKLSLRPTIILLSGPTDNWNSDSAWFARLAPKLAKHNYVICVDRAGQVLGNSNAIVGYSQFGSQLDNIFQQLQLKNIKILSFASANLALAEYLSQSIEQTVESIVMIDPDVLLPYSIRRYSKDALPFKKGLTQYIPYIESGKYDKRARQKNTTELKQLKKLSADDKNTDWKYVNYIFSQRLDKQNLKNLFREISIYDQELKSSYKVTFPKNIPITIIDTDFEQAYIDKTNDKKLKKELLEWKKEAVYYYKKLINSSIRGKYIPLKTQEHLLPFSHPELLMDLFND